MHDLAKRSRVVGFMPFNEASGGMTVCNLGGHKDNYAEWNDVYSEEGGKYKMTVFYVPAEKKGRSISDHCLEVTVNGTRISFDDIEKDRTKGVSSVTFTVDLKSGYNVVRMGSRYTWTPDIDCFTLETVQE